MTTPAHAPPPRFEVIQTHAASCRVNLVCWDLTEREAARVLRELEDAQRARQGAILVAAKPEMGWTFLIRQQGAPEPFGDRLPAPGPGLPGGEAVAVIPRAPRRRATTGGHG